MVREIEIAYNRRRAADSETEQVADRPGMGASAPVGGPQTCILRPRASIETRPTPCCSRMPSLRGHPIEASLSTIAH